MNILLMYATYSGSTGEAVQLASASLTAAGHTVTVKTPMEVAASDIEGAQFLLLASPSWEYEGKDGQPHEDFMLFMKAQAALQLGGKPYAILGLGDTAYPHFCGAVDVLEEFLNARGGKKTGESLRIDKYFSNHDNPQKVSAWASKVAPA